MKSPVFQKAIAIESGAEGNREYHLTCLYVATSKQLG